MSRNIFDCHILGEKILKVSKGRAGDISKHSTMFINGQLRPPHQRIIWPKMSILLRSEACSKVSHLLGLHLSNHSGPSAGGKLDRKMGAMIMQCLI